jgi:hypothetical protein
MSEKLIPAIKWVVELGLSPVEMPTKDLIDRVQRNAFEATKAKILHNIGLFDPDPIKIERTTFEEVRDG